MRHTTKQIILGMVFAPKIRMNLQITPMNVKNELVILVLYHERDQKSKREGQKERWSVVCFLITFDNASLVDMSSQGESQLRPREPKIKGERERKRDRQHVSRVYLERERRRGEEQRRKKRVRREGQI